jgi:molybdate transport system ATP-binding protein
LFGASGAGKTTVLDCIAGLARPDSGKIAVGDDLFDSAKQFDLPAWKRRIGYVTQDLALFPHLTAEENVAFGLHAFAATERQERSRDMLRTVVSNTCVNSGLRKFQEANGASGAGSNARHGTARAAAR